MPTDSLPERPNLEQLEANAITLRDLVRAGAPGAIELVGEHHPRLGGLVAGSPPAVGFELAEAQLTLARHFGYTGWQQLRTQVELINRLTRAPHTATVGAPTEDDDGRADELLRLACLNYGADDPARWTAAARLLAEHPQLSGRSIHTAAATGDAAVARSILADDPAAANRQGGPFDWEPLLYLSYSRLPEQPAGGPLAVAGLLLEHGADPNAGYLWDGLPSPFTALTGAFGGGEQGAPPHRDELELAGLLLEAGAEANDSQTIYNRGLGGPPEDDTDFLELLLAHGLGRGDGGPWRRRLIVEHQSPQQIVADALQHAAEAGLSGRVGVLLAGGVDPSAPGSHPIFGGRTPYAGAVVHGHRQIATLLVEAGASTSGVGRLDHLAGACLAADRAAVDAAQASDPGALAELRERHPDLVRTAAGLGREQAIRLLVALGFDVDARRSDTALHQAAWRGDLATVRLLLELGADPTITDETHQGTARDWAEHNGQQAVIDYLDRR